MVARISFPKRLIAVLNYNENKCSKGKAECIAAVNYLREAKDMNFHNKLSILESRNELNDRATTKTIHVSLNFDPSEKLEDEKLKSIANAYMKKVAFGEQPFLVYKHNDAGHPHVHIVSTTIKEDGSRIHTHNIGRTLSEKARKEIEIAFGLVKAEKQKQSTCKTINAVDAEKIIYGKTELKRSISNVVNEVFTNYRFSSLPEFNAALKQFNVLADRGNEDGRVYKNGGLVYRVLDDKGIKVGVPIKASLISCQPILKNLETKFIDKALKEPFKERIQNAIDEAAQSSSNLDLLIDELKKKRIVTVLRQNEEGRIYGITFVDNEKKVVINGSDLGKEYSAANLMKRLEVAKDAMERKELEEEKRCALSESLAFVATKKETESIIEELTSAQANNQNVPFQLRKRKKKKKSKRNFNT